MNGAVSLLNELQELPHHPHHMRAQLKDTRRYRLARHHLLLSAASNIMEPVRKVLGEDRQVHRPGGARRWKEDLWEEHQTQT